MIAQNVPYIAYCTKIGMDVPGTYYLSIIVQMPIAAAALLSHNTRSMTSLPPPTPTHYADYYPEHATDHDASRRCLDRDPSPADQQRPSEPWPRYSWVRRRRAAFLASSAEKNRDEVLTHFGNQSSITVPGEHPKVRYGGWCC